MVGRVTTNFGGVDVVTTNFGGVDGYNVLYIDNTKIRFCYSGSMLV